MRKNEKALLRFERWEKRAEDDEGAIEAMLKEGGPPNPICFHSQQMTEKYLKGFLVFHKREFEKTHRLNHLRRACEAIDPDFADLKADTQSLSVFYFETRYPGDVPEFSMIDAEAAYEAATRIKDFVKEKIEST